MEKYEDLGESAEDLTGAGEFTELEEMGDFDPERGERERNLDKLVEFLDRDVEVKKELLALAPEGWQGAEAGIEYSDRLDRGMADISENIEAMMAAYYPSETLQGRLEEIAGDVVSAGAEMGRLEKVYREDFTGMSENFVTEVAKESGGYLMFKDPHRLDKEVRSVNEMLHLMHMSVMNNEGILKGLPIVAENEEGDTLYGREATEIATGIFEGLEKDELSGEADIVALGERTLMMVRDRGHALSIDIQKDPDGRIYVNYFIPKICNVEKVNQLPGVRKVVEKPGERQTNEATSGVFAVGTEAEVPEKVLEFIAAVPTDDDIEWGF